MIRIITDGACRGNPGPGGWAALIICEGEGEQVTLVEEIGGHEPDTTNNRMELRAAIEGLRRVPPDAQVQIVADSQYLVKGMTEWLPRWKRREWRTASGHPVENRDLWEELDQLAGDRVVWEHVRGHAGHPENERVNALAQAYALGKEPSPPPGPQTICEGRDEHRVVPTSRQPERPSGTTYLSLVDGVLVRHSNWRDCQARVGGVSGAKFKKCRSLEEEVATVTAWGLLPDALLSLDVVISDEPAVTDLPRAFLLCRPFLPQAQHSLAQVGFAPVPSNHPDAAFRLQRGRAIVEAYTSGKVQPQGRWTTPDLRLWQTLPQAEESWLADQLAALHMTAPSERPDWSEAICSHLWDLLSRDQLPGWWAEQIGRYLLVRDKEQGEPVGILSPAGWHSRPHTDAEIRLWQAYNAARHRPDRWCAGRVQRQDGGLSVAVVPLTPAVQFLARARAWDRAREVPEKEQSRILAQVQRAIPAPDRWDWTSDEWRRLASAVGNQLDVLYGWLGQAVCQGATALKLPLTWPLELIMKPTGNEDWAHRLLEQRTQRRVHFRHPLLIEEEAGEALAKFLAYHEEDNDA